METLYEGKAGAPAACPFAPSARGSFLASVVLAVLPANEVLNGLSTTGVFSGSCASGSPAGFLAIGVVNGSCATGGLSFRGDGELSGVNAGLTGIPLFSPDAGALP